MANSSDVTRLEELVRPGCPLSLLGDNATYLLVRATDEAMHALSLALTLWRIWVVGSHKRAFPPTAPVLPSGANCCRLPVPIWFDAQLRALLVGALAHVIAMVAALDSCGLLFYSQGTLGVLSALSFLSVVLTVLLILRMFGEIARRIHKLSARMVVLIDGLSALNALTALYICVAVKFGLDSVNDLVLVVLSLDASFVVAGLSFWTIVLFGYKDTRLGLPASTIAADRSALGNIRRTLMWMQGGSVVFAVLYVVALPSSGSVSSFVVLHWLWLLCYLVLVLFVLRVIGRVSARQAAAAGRSRVTGALEPSEYRKGLSTARARTSFWRQPTGLVQSAGHSPQSPQTRLFDDARRSDRTDAALPRQPSAGEEGPGPRSPVPPGSPLSPTSPRALLASPGLTIAMISVRSPLVSLPGSPDP